jgi:hypothetical protein
MKTLFCTPICTLMCYTKSDKTHHKLLQSLLRSSQTWYRFLLAPRGLLCYRNNRKGYYPDWRRPSWLLLLVRRTLAFFKKPQNHIGAVWILDNVSLYLPSSGYQNINVFAQVIG